MRGALVAIALGIVATPAGAQERFIPLELILGAPWDGEESIKLPAGTFRENVSDSPSVWTGPRAWTHPFTGETLQVYDRARANRRQTVEQIFAVRHDSAAIGRVADSRFGIAACDQEAKYPLGPWRQGELRRFEYTCWYGRTARTRRSTIEILRIDYDCAVAHCLAMRWIHIDPDGGRELDRKEYVFAPGRGLVAFR